VSTTNAEEIQASKEAAKMAHCRPPQPSVDNVVDVDVVILLNSGTV
jgi:hypothetical protein